MSYKIAILGASGYTGVELVRLLLTHSQVEITQITSESSAGKDIGEVFSHLSHSNLPKLKSIAKVDFDSADIVFLCLPHATTQEVALKIPKDKIIIDLSADFRIEDAANYQKWYGKEHVALKLQKKAVYGLTELNRDRIKSSKLIANPGCYPTSILLPILPLIEKNLINPANIIADSKSGISGAGRKANTANLLAELGNNFKPYGIAGHRHVAEVEQEIAKLSGRENPISFTPQVLPISRGILSTIYVENNPNVTSEDIKKTLQEKYDNESFVYIYDDQKAPQISDVVSTNNCTINVFEDRVAGRTIIISVIDNLVKGASGQAVQNMNVILGLDETLGLKQTPVFP